MPTLRFVLLWLAASPALAEAPTKPATFTCPERLRTMAATPADPSRIAGFQPVFAAKIGSQNFLQDVAIHDGSGMPLPGKPEGKKAIAWTFDGTAEVSAACIYEGGVSLTRPLGRPSSCTAQVLRSRDQRSPEGWGMDRASFRCR